MDERTEGDASPVEALPALAASGDYDELEAAWMEAVEADALSPEDAVMVLRAAAERPGNARSVAAHLESLAWFLLSEWADRKGTQAALDVAVAAADCLPATDTVREQVADLYRREHADFPSIDVLTQTTLLESSAPLVDGVLRTGRALALPPGTFVRDPRRRSPGRVVGFDESRGGVEVAFGESGKVYDPASLDVLERLAPDDYRALAAFETERLAALAAEDPERLAVLLLRAHGPRLSLQDFRALLEPAVPSKEWSRWWKAARPVLKRAHEIEMTEGTRPDLILRARPMTFEDQVRRDYEALASAEDRAGLVLAHLSEPAVADPEAEGAVLAYLAARLEAEAAEAGPAWALGLRAVLAPVRRRMADLGAAPPESSSPETPSTEVPEPAAARGLLAATGNDALARSVLEYVRDAAGDAWPEALAAALPACSPNVAKWAARELAEAGREAALREAVSAVLARPVESAGALVWLWRSGCGEGGGAGLELSADERFTAAAGLLSAADELKREKVGSDEAARRYLPDLQRALTAKGFATFRRVLQESTEGQARGLRVLASRNAGLTDLARLRLQEAIREAHPALHVEKAVPPWEEDVIYSTEEALRARQKEFEQLVNVKMPENRQAISSAAGHGDLSENAEFTAALEERDRLVERAKRMQEDLAKARVLKPGSAETDHVTVGSRVTARDLATGRTEQLTFLGPWDADPQRGIYDYRTPLGLAFMGKRVGEKAEMARRSETRRWEILETGPAL